MLGQLHDPASAKEKGTAPSCSLLNLQGADELRAKADSRSGVKQLKPYLNMSPAPEAYYRDSPNRN
eukprot:154504-Chlamydomonas_euryale.AAC.2